MIRRASLNVSLTSELMAFNVAQAGSGRSGNASEAGRTGLRLPEDRQVLPWIGAPRRTAPDGH